MKMTTKRCEEIFTLFFSFIRKIYFKNHTYLFNSINHALKIIVQIRCKQWNE